MPADDMFFESAAESRESYYSRIAGMSNSDWRDRPMGWLAVIRGPTAKGKEAQRLLAHDLGKRRLPVVGEGTSYTKIGHHTCALRFSTLNAKPKVFRFSQFHLDKFDIGVCFGITPQNEYLWAIPLDVLRGHLGVQDKRTGAMTFELDPENQDWAIPYGGDYVEGVEILRASIAA